MLVRPSDEQIAEGPARRALIAAGCAAFEEHFGAPEPSALVFAPGRVNLIGDHTDYNGLPVLPMALQRGIVILLRPRPDETVRVANLDPRFPPRTFRLHAPIDSHPSGDWVNYVKAAAQALTDRHGQLVGVDALIASDLAVAVGLSSSSALTVASALGLLHAADIEMERHDLMSLIAEGERYVGTEGGGMDQAICLGGRRQYALRIDFDPLHLTATPVPPEWRFVVASSLTEAQKSGAAREIYNLRGRECASALDAVRAKIERAESTDGFRELMARTPLSELIALSQEVLNDRLARRFRHVATEAERVERAYRAMMDGDLEGFGRLMIESHRSLRDDFEVSCEALDDLVEASIAGGAAGARLTGAGFGGCVVALCHVDRTSALVEHLTTKFYEPRGVRDALAGLGSGAGALLVAEPSDGARVTAL